MKILITLFLLIFSSIALAGDAVLLTSLKLSPVAKFRLERKFKASFKGHSVKIQHDVTPETLFNYTISPQTEYLFWVSHATGSTTESHGLGAKNLIADKWGNDVAPFFSSLSPHIRYLALVGCISEGIVTEFRRKGFFPEGLNIKSFPKKVQMLEALDEALADSKNLKDHSPQEEALPVFGDDYVMKFNRSSEKPETLGSAWVIQEGKLVGYFSKGSLSATSLGIHAEFFYNKKNKNLKYHLDLSQSTQELGDLEIITTDLSEWRLFTDKEGRPIGKTGQHLYIYKN